jgi:uncharacterized sulfatase
VLLLTMAMLALACSAQRQRPNIVLIVGDDQDHMDFGLMGSPYVETPHLDRLAAGGTVFTQGQGTASVCRPSLRTLLTGLEPLQWQLMLDARERTGQPVRERQNIRHFATLPRLLGQQGYRSYQAGKFW